MNQGLKIDIYSHHFQVGRVSSYYSPAVESFSQRLVQVDINKDAWGNITKESVRIFATRAESESGYIYRFHINIYDEFTDFMLARGFTLTNVTKHGLYEPGRYEFKMKDGWEPFPEQVPVIDYLVKPGLKKVIDANTGSGKTVMTLMALSQINQRCALVVKPMYIERWLDVTAPGPKQALKDFTVKDVMTVRGGGQLRSLIHLAQEGELKAKFLILSNRTMANYFQDYSENGATEEYGFVKPEDLWQLLDVGVRLIDEAHQDFFACFVTDLNSHVPKSIELSGTLEPDDKFLRHMYQIMYPPALRLNTGTFTPYVELYALNYSISNHPKPIKTMRRGRSSYSQAAFEEDIFKNPKRKGALMKMMHDVVETWFISERQPGYKLLVFFDTVDMCRETADYLGEMYPNLKVSKYTQEEDASVLDEYDIIVATPGSAGTAVDITNLQQVICFVMRSSTQALKQYLGRLRKLKTDKVNPKYIYLFSNDVGKHITYHHKMQDTYNPITVSSERMILNHTL